MEFKDENDEIAKQEYDNIFVMRKRARLMDRNKNNNNNLGDIVSALQPSLNQNTTNIPNISLDYTHNIPEYQKQYELSNNMILNAGAISFSLDVQNMTAELGNNNNNNNSENNNNHNSNANLH